MSWREYRLGEVCSLFYGKALSDYVERPDEDYSFRAFGTNGPIGWARDPLIDEPTIIVGRKGAYRGIHYSNEPSWTIDTAFFTKINRGLVYARWLYYRLLLVDINSMNSGGAIPSTSRDDFYSVSIHVPDQQTQSRIASILSSYDDLIENNQRRIALLEESARLLYREWFVHFRFPGHEHVKIVDGLPQGWASASLGDLLTLKRGYDLPEAQRVPGSIPIVSSSGISGYHDTKKADKPGIVTGRYGTLGDVYLVDEDFWPLNTALYVSDKKGNPVTYLFHVLKHVLDGVQSEKAAVPGLNRNTLHIISVARPPRKLMADFENAVGGNYEQISTLKAMNQKLAQARDLLLPRLMSGEISV